MPVRLRIAAGIVLAGALIGLAGFSAYSKRLGPLVQQYGTTYYNGDGPSRRRSPASPRARSSRRSGRCTPNTTISRGPISGLSSSARRLKGLPPLNIEKLYVITEDDQLRDGEMVLFIGLRVDCVTTVFGLPTKLYRELAGKSGNPRPAP